LTWSMRLEFLGISVALVLLLAPWPQLAWTEPIQTGVSPSEATLQGKLIVGYQGWFGCPDTRRNSPTGWVHWMKDGDATVDMLPDTRK
jgi:hypothetical protein